MIENYKRTLLILMSVLLETSFGDIVVDLFTSRAPLAATNFLKLCKLKHYNNALFHHVQKDHTAKITTSSPTTIWHTTGSTSSRHFSDQIDVETRINEIGLLATSNPGPNLNDSQFFITLTKANLSSLQGKHTLFGKIQEGFDVLRKINETYVDEGQRPQINIRILHTFILDDPFEDIPRMPEPPRSPSPVTNSDRLEATEHLKMLEQGKTEADIAAAAKQQKAKKQAMTLEMLGELPDASVKPPQNILFVCKLNPVTQERDLEVIFSRFGPIRSVEIVRDWKTGQSLQYGFIEFENSKACEEAYLKMNNVVIDERRIQVDFSQSVSKLLHKRGDSKNFGNLKPRVDPQSKRQLLPRGHTQGRPQPQSFALVSSQAHGRHRNRSRSRSVDRHKSKNRKRSRSSGSMQRRREKKSKKDRR